MSKPLKNLRNKQTNLSTFQPSNQPILQPSNPPTRLTIFFATPGTDSHLQSAVHFEPRVNKRSTCCDPPKNHSTKKSGGMYLIMDQKDERIFIRYCHEIQFSRARSRKVRICRIESGFPLVEIRGLSRHCPPNPW